MSDPDEQRSPAAITAEAAPTDDPMPTHRRWAISAVMLTVVVFLFFLFAWWAQDVVAPFVNEGEADITQTVTFTADSGTYRVVTSGPARPEALRMKCTVISSDGSSEVIFAGDGSITPHDRFGVSRVLEFEVVAGPTSVTCNDEKSPTASGGRFQIVEAGGIQQIGLIAGALVGVLAAISLVTTVVTRLRRQRAAP